MTTQDISRTLERQLQLLSERSKECDSDAELGLLTCEMISISEQLATLKKTAPPSLAWRVTFGIMLAGAVLNLVALLARFQL